MAANQRAKTKNSIGGMLGGVVAPVRSLSPNLVFSLMLLGICVAGGMYAWKHGGIQERARSAGRLTIDKLEITPQPAWIRTDVRAEAFRDGSLAELSGLDRELAYRVFRAFELHAWVDKVNRVSKQPQGRVLVDVRYRRPVAWVEVPSIMSPENKDGVLPIDGLGVLLPPDDFRSQDVTPYLRIAVSDLAPWGPVGTAWPDPRVVGAARIAVLVENQWPALGLHRILVHTPMADARRGERPVYELTTRHGHRLIWGCAPGEEKANEASTGSKIALLRQLADRADRLTSSERLELDLRRQGVGAPR